MNLKRFFEPLLSYLALFTSLGTLFCCALPIVFVMLGAGAVFAGLSANFPQISWIAEHKNYIFIFAAIMILLNAFLHFKNRYASCPADPDLAKSCLRLRRIKITNSRLC